MAIYFSKGKEIDAVQYDGTNRYEIEQWMIGRYDPNFVLDEWIGDGPYFKALLIIDEKRKITARQDDYVVRGEDNLFYSMSKDLFEQLFSSNGNN